MRTFFKPILILLIATNLFTAFVLIYSFAQYRNQVDEYHKIIHNQNRDIRKLDSGNHRNVAKIKELESIINNKIVPKTVILDIKPYKQKYKGSCEVASLKETMRYFGVEKTEEEIFDFIGIDPIAPDEKEDVIYWGNPQKSFIGSLEPPGLVYNDPIYRYLEAHGFQSSINKSNWNTEELFHYVKSGFPAIVWTSSDFKTQPKKTLIATDGTTHIWFPHEHGLILKGVDSKNAYIMDVWTGYEYPVTHETFKTGFANLDNTAIVVIKDVNNKNTN